MNGTAAQLGYTVP